MFDNKLANIDFDEDLVKKYLAVVEDIDDPLKIGRVKARIEWLFGDIPVEDLPWANPKHTMFFGGAGGCGQFSVPKVGSIIEVWFCDNNLYSPEYRNIQELSNDAKAILAKEYDGTHLLAVDGDEELKVYYTRGRGLTLQLKGSRVNISNDKSVTIEHDETSSIIELRGGTITVTSDSQINMTAGTRIKETSSEVWVDGKSTKLGHTPICSAVLGEPLMQLLLALANTIDAKLFPTPGVSSGLVEQMKKLILSDTVKVSK